MFWGMFAPLLAIVLAIMIGWAVKRPRQMTNIAIGLAIAHSAFACALWIDALSQENGWDRDLSLAVAQAVSGACGVGMVIAILAKMFELLLRK